MDNQSLHQENLAFAGTPGVSMNASPGYHPAFLDRETGEIALARNASGEPTPFHLIAWLPKAWAAATNPDGSVAALKPGVIAGFECNGVFYTRDQAAEL